MKILLGIQPTGRLHIGNYFGALKKGLEMQEEHNVTFLVANYHAGLLPNSRGVLDMCAELRKLGVANIEQQIPKDLEVFYTLAHSTSVAELARLPQYQTKEQTLHMLSYPLLMACDIMLSNCDAVIVGDDQTPHMQFYRDIAERNGFNVAVTIKSNTPRLMSIKDPSKKMSKSLGDEHCIYLDDTPEEIFKKIIAAPTTTEGIDNLRIISSLYGVEFNSDRCLDSKNILADTISKFNYSIGHKN